MSLRELKIYYAEKGIHVDDTISYGEVRLILSVLGYQQTTSPGRVKSSKDMLEFDTGWWGCLLF